MPLDIVWVADPLHHISSSERRVYQKSGGRLTAGHAFCSGIGWRPHRTRAVKGPARNVTLCQISPSKWSTFHDGRPRLYGDRGVIPMTSLRIRCGVFSTMYFAIMTRNLCTGVRARKRLVRDSDFSGVEMSITRIVRCSRKLDLVCSECSSLLVLTSIIRKHRCSPMQV